MFNEFPRRRNSSVVSGISSNVHLAPAGLIGVNLWPQEPNRRYLLCPRSMFCEFLPESSLEEETPHTLLMEEVQEGQNYELVVTNASGLFRSDFMMDLMMNESRFNQRIFSNFPNHRPEKWGIIFNNCFESSATWCGFTWLPSIKIQWAASPAR